MKTFTFVASALLAVVALQGPAFAASAEKGKTAYVKHGCWQCHGFVGQGGGAGPKIAPDPMPLPALTAFLRGSARAMPPYEKAILPDGDIADIHAYLESVPKTADIKTIPLLSSK